MATSLAYGTITISDLADGAQIWTTNQTPTTSNNQYVFIISQLVGDGNADVKVGDLVFSGEYRYTIISVGNTTVTTDYRTSLKGIQGEQGYSLRGSYIRDKWTNTQWTGTYGVIGNTASFSNYDILSSGNQTNGKYAITSWSVGDIFFLTGTATDTGIAYTATYTVTSKPTSNTGTVASSCIAFAHAERGATGATGNGILSKTDYYMLADTMDSTALDTAKAHFPQDVSGSIVSISDAMGGVPFENVTASIPVTQSGSGDPSPTNIRPITGWTGATVTRTGKNIFGGNLLRDGIKAAIPTASDHADIRAIDYAVTVPVYGSFTKAASLDGKFKENTAYTFIVTLETTQSRSTNMRIYYTDGTHINIPNVSGINTKETKVVVTSPNKTVQNIYRVYSDTSVTRVYYDESGLFEGVLTLSDFEPYNGASYPVTWSEAGTVYGGTLDVVRGKLTVTHSGVDLGTLNWTKMTNYSYGTFESASKLDDAKSSANTPLWLCSHYKSVTANSGSTSTGDNYVWLRNSSGYKIMIKDTAKASMTKEEFKTAMNGATFVYELATPIEYDLTPTEIETLLGQNNVWADTGDISLTYYNEIDAAWQTTLPEANKYARYLWWYYHTIYTNGDETDSEPAIIGIYNDDWADDAVKAQQMAQQAQDTANSAAGAAGTNKTAIDTLQDVIYGTEDEPGLQSEISTLKSNTTVTASSLEKLRTDAVARLNTLESQLGQYQAWIRFDGTNGLIIGKEKMTTEEGQEDTSVNPYILQLEGDCISFYEATDIGDKTKRVGYIQNKLLYIESSIFSDQMDLGNFRFVKQDSGNLSLVWKG